MAEPLFTEWRVTEAMLRFWTNETAVAELQARLKRSSGGDDG